MILRCCVFGCSSLLNSLLVCLRLNVLVMSVFMGMVLCCSSLIDVLKLVVVYVSVLCSVIFLIVRIIGMIGVGLLVMLIIMMVFVGCICFIVIGRMEV